MAEISIIMAVCGDEDHIAESIESILNQSFRDFELIITTCGSTDGVRSAISSYEDRRISLIDGGNDYIESINSGLRVSQGKYVVHMHVDDLMHVDRLRLNYSRMEESPEITVCCSWVYLFGEKVNKRIIDDTVSELIELPSLRMILDESSFNFGSMIRKSFLFEHDLTYQDYYIFAEDFKLSADIANSGGIFYMESQPLIYRRMSDVKILRKHRLEKIRSVFTIKKEILNSLCGKNGTYPAFASLCDSYFKLTDQDLISQDEIFRTIHALIVKNQDKFNL